jgi:hypothetical protein
MSENDAAKNYPIKEQDNGDWISEESALTSWDPNSPFNPENLMPILVIMSNRIYDLLMIIARSGSPQIAREVEKLHEQGLTLAPHIAYSIPEDVSEDNDE